MLESEEQLENARRKLAALEVQISKAKDRPASPQNAQSLRSLVQMANQMKEEMIRFQDRRQRQAS